MDLRESGYFRQSDIDVQQKKRHPDGLGLMHEGKSERKQQKNREVEEKENPQGARLVLLLLSEKQRGEGRDFSIEHLFRKTLSSLL